MPGQARGFDGRQPEGVSGRTEIRDSEETRRPNRIGRSFSPSSLSFAEFNHLVSDHSIDRSRVEWSYRVGSFQGCDAKSSALGHIIRRAFGIYFKRSFCVLSQSLDSQAAQQGINCSIGGRRVCHTDYGRSECHRRSASGYKVDNSSKQRRRPDQQRSHGC